MKKPSKETRIRELVQKHPLATAVRIASMVNCNVVYVHAVKKLMREEAQTKAMAKQPVKVLEPVRVPAPGIVDPLTARDLAAIFDKPVEAPPLSGGSNSYYQLLVGDRIVECNDIIEKLGLNYAEGNVLKAVWRRALARNGVGKPGSTALYESEKIEYFGRCLVEQAKG